MEEHIILRTRTLKPTGKELITMAQAQEELAKYHPAARVEDLLNDGVILCNREAVYCRPSRVV